MTQIYYNTTFKDMSIKNIDTWISFNYERLIGSAVFTKNKSITSKLVCWAEKWRCKDKCFVPSHTGSIIEYNSSLYIFDMKPLKARIQSLNEYLLNTKEDFALVLRDFMLDTKMFSINIAEHIGEFYPYMSAVRSVFTKRQSKWRRHCSELHLRELQKQGILTELNPEITPDELLHAMVNKNANNRL